MAFKRRASIKIKKRWKEKNTVTREVIVEAVCLWFDLDMVLPSSPVFKDQLVYKGREYVFKYNEYVLTRDAKKFRTECFQKGDQAVGIAMGLFRTLEHQGWISDKQVWLLFNLTLKMLGENDSFTARLSPQEQEQLDKLAKKKSKTTIDREFEL